MWDSMCKKGPKYGYFPLASNTILIVKEEHREKAVETFGETEVTISTQVERYVGSVSGSQEFKHEYVRNKISKWVEDVETLIEIAKDEPHAVYSSFTKSVSHRWTYIQQTIPDIADSLTGKRNL